MQNKEQENKNKKTKDKNDHIAIKEKINIVDTNIDKLKPLVTKDAKIVNILLCTIIGLTILDLLLYIFVSPLTVLYIPIMCVVFVLLAIYNSMNTYYLAIDDNTLMVYDRKDYSHIIELKELKEIREKKDTLSISLKNDNFLELKTKNKTKVFETLKKGILEK